MSKFIRVTKDNRNKDRGFIAVDAICAVFENQDSHTTEIMTMDGFWYEVVDGVEKVYADATGKDKTNDGKSKEPIPRECEEIQANAKVQFVKNRRLVAPAVSEDAKPKRHEEVRGFKRRSFSYQKKYSHQKNVKISDFPSSEGEGHLKPRTKTVDFTPNEPKGM